jgi:acyl carrier protein
MSISSRTPEGSPGRCPVCGQDADLEFSLPGGDALCASCGSSRQRLRDRLPRDAARSLDALLADNPSADSLDTVELVMLIEEGLDLEIPDADAEQLQTFRDVIQYLIRRTL